MKQSLYGEKPIESVENLNEFKNGFSGNIGFTLSQILSNDVAKTLR